LNLSKKSIQPLLFILPYFLFFILLLYPSISKGQNVSIKGSTQIDTQYFFSYWHDTKSVASDPFRWKGKQWSQFAAVVGVGLITYVYDEEIYNFFQQHKSTTTETISKVLIEPWGSGLYSVPLLAGIYFSGSKNSHHRRIALTGIKAFILSGGAAVISKHLFHRHRPFEDDPPDPYQWEGPFPFTTRYTSFPSGHTTTAFAVASVIAMGYNNKTWVVVSSYTIAGLVGISRIHDGDHWGSDVIAGAALGSFIGIALSKINLKKVNLSPAAFKGGQGLRITYSLY